MILTAHQPVYLPWLGLFHKIALADEFVSFNQVQYQIYGWNNRNYIKTQHGKLLLSVPVLRKNHLNRSYADMEINNQLPWARKHWSSLQIAYSRAPFFRRYKDFFEDIYSRHWVRLADLNETMLRGLLVILGINVSLRSAQECNFRGSKGDLVLDMCLKLKAKKFIFGKLGRDYADVAAFEAAGVKAYFQDYQHPVYLQQYGQFVSHLSIVDLLFNCGDDSLEILMSGNLSREDITSGDNKT